MRFFSKLILLLIVSYTSNFAQEIQAKVSLNYEALSNQYRENLISFAQQIEDYINKNKWTDINWIGPKIPVTIQIYFRSASGANRYSAQVVISSQRPIYNSQSFALMLKVMDNNWEFTYDKNQVLYFNPNLFDPLTSFIDYYMYVILGLDSDSYEEFGGTQFFSKALSIANQGASSPYPSGWVKGEGSYNRTDFVSEILNEKFQGFRKAYFDYHYNGLDLKYEDTTIALQKLVKLINIIEDLRQKVFTRSQFLKVFFDTKHLEFCEELKNYSDKRIFETLKRVDPAHISTYNECGKN